MCSENKNGLRFAYFIWRPIPINPIVILFDGAVLPNTEDGTIVGKPIAAPTIAALFINFRRLIDTIPFFLLIIILSLLLAISFYRYGLKITFY